jgi:hypothetical protein
MSIQPPKDKAERDARLDLVLTVIESNPDLWGQCTWHCGTSHCFAGHAQLLAHQLPADSDIDDFDGFINRSGGFSVAWEDSDKWLGVEFSDHELYLSGNTLPDLRRIVSEIKATDYSPPAVEAAP